MMACLPRRPAAWLQTLRRSPGPVPQSGIGGFSTFQPATEHFSLIHPQPGRAVETATTSIHIAIRVYDDAHFVPRRVTDRHRRWASMTGQAGFAVACRRPGNEKRRRRRDRRQLLVRSEYPVLERGMLLARSCRPIITTLASKVPSRSQMFEPCCTFVRA